MAAGGAYTENAGRCAYCHTTEAFIQVNIGKMPTDQPNGSPPWVLCLPFTTFKE